MKTQLAYLIPKSRLSLRIAYSLTAFMLATMLWACDRASDSAPAPAQATVTADQYRAMRTSFNSLDGDWSLTTYRNAPLPASLQNKTWLRFTKESDDS